MKPPPAPEARTHDHDPQARAPQAPSPSRAEPSTCQAEPGSQAERGPGQAEWGAGQSAQVPRPAKPVPRQAELAHNPTDARHEHVQSVPRQTDGTRTTEPRPGPATDALHHPDPHTAAQAAAVENVLRCWVREHNLTSPHDGTLHIPLPTTGTTLLAPVRYWSPTGWHRFGLPHFADTPETAPPVDAVTVAALLVREAAARGPHETGVHEPPPTAASTPASPTTGRPDQLDPLDRPGRFRRLGPLDQPGQRAQRDRPGRFRRFGTVDEPGQPGQLDRLDQPGCLDQRDRLDQLELVGRVADSARRVAVFIAERRAEPADHPDRFLAAEQALVLGHPLHPTPKSREGLSEAEARLYSPELRGSFPLHWMAIAPSVLSTDSAWTERGRVIPAEQLTARLVGPGLPLPDGYAALPLHPWQLREVRHRPAVAALLDAGLLRDLGPHGDPWHPTSSVRTVHRTGAPAMLKLSLGLCITNSRRENLRKELHRGVEVHRLLRTGLAEQWQAIHPGFDLVRDPAWLAVTARDGDPLPGMDVVIRHNPFGPADDASCIAGLVSPRPYARSGRRADHFADHPGEPQDCPDDQEPERPGGPLRQGRDTPPDERLTMRSRLADVVTRLAGHTGRPRGAVAAEWFLRYLEQVVRPVLWLDSEAGIALEAHQQNTLVLLDPDGWPMGGRYRDNQGYYFRESRRADLEARLPGIGERSDTFVSDEVTDERFAYYLGINNVLGLIGAFGSQRLADERLLLAAFRRFLTDMATGPARMNTTLPARLLDSPVLRCKANLLTRLHGLDELVGPVDTQSVYVTIANPLHR
ncbi:IucA/IucC family protein [Streptomyces sp. NPDC057474]|uniref:IucA/IucC family protein n=1 Tax=Streptomyces sp. NPDC057474 TaxID=3346144 RepID=UPI00369FDC42